jgi:diguanylate cyclase (GGDEF)-like protein
MNFFSNISIRRAILLSIIVVSILTAGTGLTIKLTTDHLIHDDARTNARDWALFLAANIPDLKLIADGELPSASSMTFLDGTRKAGQVFRSVIYNRQGYSQFLADHENIKSIELSEFSPEAAEAVVTRQTVIDVSEGNSGSFPEYFARAFVPVVVDGNPVAVVATFVDETQQRTNFHKTFLIAAVVLCGFIVIAFGVPYIGWYKRTRQKQRSDRRLRFLAHHDPLTGLANRARLVEGLDAALAALPSIGGYIALHFIDIDRFKEVNDSLGHDGGDFLLSTIGRRLSALTRAEDLVARLGGDEFVVVQAAVSNKEQVGGFARRIAAALNEPVEFNGSRIKVSVTIGAALAPTDGTTSERLLKSADIALYDGKGAGRNCIRFFSPELDEALETYRKLEKEIRDAVENGGFVLHYQPVFDIKHNRLIGYEALVRLLTATGALISPDKFIPVAESAHLIDKVGAWVLREACMAAALWPKELIIAVNLSPTQFEPGTIVDVVSAALKDSGLDPHRLELEITEILLLGDNVQTMNQLRELKAIGASIVMDDFGTGYSSLSYLWKFPFDKIKIDRSFMQNFERSGELGQTVVKSIIALARELRMQVTVEGVETLSQAEFLRNTTANQVQGFYFGRPIPASEIGENILADFRKTKIGIRSPSNAKIKLVKS